MTDQDFYAGAQDSAKAGSGEKNPTFKWETPEQELKGRLVDVRAQPLQSGEVVLMATIAEDGTENVWTVWLSSKILLEGFIDAAPKQGTLVYVYYEGKKPTKDGTREYNMFHVRAQAKDHEWWGQLQLDRVQVLQDKNPAGGGGGGGFAGPSESPF